MLAPLLSLALLAAPNAKPTPASNTKCPVTGEAVTGKSQTVVVRGHAYRICCPGCDAQLHKDSGKYLEQDGTPRNAPKSSGEAMPGMAHH